jgi:hypothetical protein
MSELWGLVKSLTTAETALVAVIITAAATLIGSLGTAVVTLINIGITNRHNRRNLDWQKEQWLKDRKKDVFLECLTCLNESRPRSFVAWNDPAAQSDPSEPRYIEDEEFLGIMLSLKRAVPLLTLLAGYCSDKRDKENIEDVRDRLNRRIDDVWTEGPLRWPDRRKKQYVWSDLGLEATVKETCSIVIDVSSRELLRGDIPTLPKK